MRHVARRCRLEGERVLDTRGRIIGWEGTFTSGGLLLTRL